MDAPPQVSEADLAATPASVLALLRWQGEQIVRLTARVAELEAKLARLQGATPANSSKPPSSTHPHDKPPPSKPKSTRKRGLVSPVMKSTSVRCCRRRAMSASRSDPSRRHVIGAANALAGVDPTPLRHQVWDLPEIASPIVVEYQRHRLVCSCGYSTCGELPQGVPTGQAGPRLIAFAALLMACFRQSKRRAARSS